MHMHNFGKYMTFCELIVKLVCKPVLVVSEFIDELYIESVHELFHNWDYSQTFILNLLVFKFNLFKFLVLIQNSYNAKLESSNEILSNQTQPTQLITSLTASDLKNWCERNRNTTSKFILFN